MLECTPLSLSFFTTQNSPLTAAELADDHPKPCDNIHFSDSIMSGRQSSRLEWQSSTSQRPSQSSHLSLDNENMRTLNQELYPRMKKIKAKSGLYVGSQ